FGVHGLLSKKPMTTPLACKLAPERFGLRLDEADKPFSLLGQRGAILFSQLVERLDHERRGGLGLFDLPRAAHEAVDQNSRRDAQTRQIDLRTIFVGDHAGAIAVRAAP